MLLQRERSDVGWSYLFFSEGQLPVPDKWCVKGYARKEECNLFDAPAGFCCTILASFASSPSHATLKGKEVTALVEVFLLF